MATATTLDMTPEPLIGTATSLVGVLEDAKLLLPEGTVNAAGGDPISDYAAGVITAQGEQHTYLIRQGWHLVDAAARAIGDAAGEIRAADAASGSGGAMTNPVGPPPRFETRSLPAAPTGGVMSLEDELEFAKQIFDQGDQGVSALALVDKLRNYRELAHAAIRGAVEDARPRIEQHWKPTGAQVANRLGDWLAWYEKVDDSVTKLADMAQTYDAAFSKVQKDHPMPAEIRYAKNWVVKTAQGTDPNERDKAIRYWEAVEAQAKQAQQQYRAAIESDVRSEDVVAAVGPPTEIVNSTSAAAGGGTPRTPAAGGAGTNETQVGKTKPGAGDTGEKSATTEDNLLKDLLRTLGENSQEADTAATTDPAAAQAANTTANPAGAGGFPGIPPMANPNAGLNPDDGRTAADLDFDDSRLGGPLNYASGSGGGYGGAPGGGGSVRTPTAGGVTGTSSASAPSAPKTPAAVSQYGLPAAARSQQASLGGGMPPYMGGGMGPGAGANGGVRPTNQFEKPQEVVNINAERAKGLPSHILNDLKVPEVTPTPKTADRTSETNQAGATA